MLFPHHSRFYYPHPISRSHQLTIRLSFNSYTIYNYTMNDDIFTASCYANKICFTVIEYKHEGNIVMLSNVPAMEHKLFN